MDFELDDDQRLLGDSVERLLADTYGFEQRARHAAEPHGFSEAVWARFAEMGLLALPFDPGEGGLGLGAVETMIVMERMGAALTLEPYLATVVLAGGLLRHGADAARRAPLVEGIAAGALRLAFAHAERRARYDLAFVETRARSDGGGHAIDGEKSLVLHGDSADRLIVSTRLAGAATDRDGIGLFLVDPADPGVTRRGYATQDGLRAAEISLSGARGTPIGMPGAALPVIERVVDEAIAALCAEAVGAMAALLEMTTGYLKTRRQFGAAIGSFQALQHRAAEMVTMLEQARSMALYATMMAASDDADARARAIHAAKVQIGRSATFVGRAAIQLHGGIGLTIEYKAGHLFKRLAMIDLAFGDADHHLARLAAMGGLPGASPGAGGSGEIAPLVERADLELARPGHGVGATR